MITVNDEPTDFEGSIAQLIALRLSEQPRGIAVALNGEVAPRGSWGDIAVADGDRIEIVTAVQGG